MAKLKKALRGVSMVAAMGLAVSITAGYIMEQYPAPLDTLFNTLSSEIVSEKTDEADWIWDSNFKTAKQAYDGYEEFAIRESVETFALLKNKSNALPIAKEQKITLLGLRSYAAIYGNNGGSSADTKTVENENRIFEAFAKEGFRINPSMLAAYKAYCDTLEWAPSNYGSSTPSYKELNNEYNAGTVSELSPTELAALKSDYQTDFTEYNTAVVVFGRPGGENYSPTPTGTDSTTGNILGLSAEEKEILNLAKTNFSKVIVLINSVNPMEIGELKTDDKVDAIMWIGFPGSHGFHGVAKVLNGEVSPSAHLGDIYAANTNVNPSMMNFGNMTPWADVSDYIPAENVNSYLIQAEGIYTGYRYYETRYYDAVLGQGNASQAKAGQYVNADTTAATADGTWNYANEVTYPFGYGLSYTTFDQTLDSVHVLGSKKQANVTVTVKNTGSVAGKDVVQVYAQTPYTRYDKDNKVEKSAIQLIDYEKTKTLAPGESQTITMEVALENLASYDYTKAKTFIVDNGTYYLSIGDDSHDALNNILAKQGKTTADGMDANGVAAKAYAWDWTDGTFDGVDNMTFSVSANNVNITNQLTDNGIFSMDYNHYESGKVTYLSRSDWKGTYPKTYSGLRGDATAELNKALKNDFYELKNDAVADNYKWGDTSSSLTLNDMKLAEWDDPRWKQIVDKVTVEEFLTFASKAFHNIQEIPSVSYLGNNADDGPGGSDSHYFQEGKYQGVAYSDGADYTGYGTRVAPSPTNLAYSWNKELAYENGEIILGETSLVMNLPIMIGPGGNIHRNAYNGRGAEYYSEDPVLSGYTGSAVVQGAQSKGCLVNIKHAAFNDQEINRSGIAVFMNEQKARELELRNLEKMFTAKGKPASFVADDSKKDTYKMGALGVMSSYNRIGAVASSANKAVMVDIMRNEWGFKGYNVTDFTGVSLKAAPKESILYGTTAFCGFGSPNLAYWSAPGGNVTQTLSNDAAMSEAIKADIKYILYSLANSNAVNGTNNTTHRVQLNSTWRKLYKSLIGVFGGLTGAAAIAWCTFEVLDVLKKKKKEAD